MRATGTASTNIRNKYEIIKRGKIHSNLNDSYELYDLNRNNYSVQTQLKNDIEDESMYLAIGSENLSIQINKIWASKAPKTPKRKGSSIEESNMKL